MQKPGGAQYVVGQSPDGTKIAAVVWDKFEAILKEI